MGEIAIIAFTRRGCVLARRIADSLGGSVHGPARFASELGIEAYQGLGRWTHDAFQHASSIVFVSASGIAVRAIAPYVADKFSDPAVVSVDEMGRFVVPLLSGHVGGANDLARTIAGITGGQAAISTATDVNGLFAVDEWARSLGLVIVERAVAKEISAVLLEGGGVCVSSDFPIRGILPTGITVAESGELGFCVTTDLMRSPFERTLHLLPRVHTLGVGCRRGKEPEELLGFVEDVLENEGIVPGTVAQVASIDLKSDEPAIHRLAGWLGCGLRFYSARELEGVPGDFASSAFVEQTTGVDNVCERAALAEGGELVVAKRASRGMTVAVGRKEFEVGF